MSGWKRFMYSMGVRLMRAGTEDLTDLSYIESRIVNWLGSPLRMCQIDGERYYQGDHDILFKKRTIIGKDGVLTEVNNLPNNRKVDNQYARMVDQKKNYLLSQEIMFNSKNEQYVEALKQVFNKRFRKTFKDLGVDTLNGGIAWLCPYYKNNELRFKKFAAYEILPFWNDTEHTDLEMAVRYYEEEKPNAINEHDTIKKVEIYTKNGVDFYTFDNNRLIPDTDKPHENYLTVGESQYNWERIPLIPFKANAKEIPLIKKCKSIQDAINDIISTFKNNMDEDTRNTILVLENYDGTNLGEFREKLAQYGVIKVRSGDGARGDVRTLNIEVNHTNYETILRMFKKAMVENCKGFDFAELRSNNDSPNQMNIKSVYADIDMDANDLEAEMQCGLEDLIWFVNKHLKNVGKGEFVDEEVEFIFNRDMIVNEFEIVQMLTNLGIKVSNETLLKQVPWIYDVDSEMKQIKKEREEEMDAYGDTLPTDDKKGGVDNDRE